MKKRDSAYIDMTNKVKTFLDLHASQWQGTVIEEVVTRLFANFDLVEETSDQQMGISTGGMTVAKDEKLHEIFAKTLKLAKKLSGYARLEKDYVLLEQTDFEITGLTQISQSKAIKKCKIATKEAMSKLEKLKAFKVTKEEIDAINAQIKEWKPLKAERSNKKAEKKVAGIDIQLQIQEIRSQFKILDDLVKGMIDDKSLIETYFTLRKIDDPKTTKRKGTNEE